MKKIYNLENNNFIKCVSSTILFKNTIKLGQWSNGQVVRIYTVIV